jgi:hypothetical protein
MCLLTADADATGLSTMDPDAADLLMVDPGKGVTPLLRPWLLCREEHE